MPDYNFRVELYEASEEDERRVFMAILDSIGPDIDFSIYVKNDDPVDFAERYDAMHREAEEEMIRQKTENVSSD